MERNINALMCDAEKGICEMPLAAAVANGFDVAPQEKPVKIIYFTDPICSSCWGIEPQLRKLKLEYGNDIEFEYRMGGLLPDWSYNSGGISKPSDVAPHWEEASHYYNMPIDGDVWLTDPLHSSYPPSIAFKAAQLQDADKAISFLRILREMVFMQKKNITRWEYIEAAAVTAGLDPHVLKDDFENKAPDLFEEDLALGRQLGVRGFPSVFITNREGNVELVYGTKAYSVFENALTAICPAVVKCNYDKDAMALFAKYPTLTRREFAELSQVTLPEALAVLDNGVRGGMLGTFVTKNGALWMRNK